MSTEEDRRMTFVERILAAILIILGIIGFMVTLGPAIMKLLGLS